MNRYAIWYMKPEHFSHGIMGVNFCAAHGKLPDAGNLDATHVQLKLLSVNGGLDAVFTEMQAERWSLNGEARDLIERKGLQHTSMSVGDIVIDDRGNAHVCDSNGWHCIGNVRSARVGQGGR